MKKYIIRSCYTLIFLFSFSLYPTLIQELQNLTLKLQQLETLLAIAPTEQYIGQYAAFILLNTSNFRSLHPYTSTGQPGQKLKPIFTSSGMNYLKNRGIKIKRVRRDSLHMTLVTFVILVPDNQKETLEEAIFRAPAFKQTVEEILQGRTGQPIKNKKIKLNFKQFTVFPRFVVTEFYETTAFANLVENITQEIKKTFPTAHLKYPLGQRPHISLARFLSTQAPNPPVALTSEEIRYIQARVVQPVEIPDMVIREPIVISVPSTYREFDRVLNLDDALQAARA